MLRLATVYDMDACRGPTGVTRHALAQIEEFRRNPEIDLRLISGRISEPDGLAYWESLEEVKRRELPLRTRDALRFWRISPWPPVDWWCGEVDWVYSPAEYQLPARPNTRLALTSHDIFQDLNFRPPRRREHLGQMFRRADLILSVSRFNTERLLEAFPGCAGTIAMVPNAADNLFFEPPTETERARVRSDLGLPGQIPYLLSVANFQPRKNLGMLIRAALKLPEVARGELGLVLIGDGADSERERLLDEASKGGAKSVVRFPGYRQEKELRAVYAEAAALVFPSLCESFGIPAVEAMAQGTPVALADTTALPEIAGEAGWYFDPKSEEALASTLSQLLNDTNERTRRAELGLGIANEYRWRSSNDRLVKALKIFLDQPRQRMLS